MMCLLLLQRRRHNAATTGNKTQSAAARRQPGARHVPRKAQTNQLFAMAWGFAPLPRLTAMGVGT
jgi:hypothetical protein